MPTKSSLSPGPTRDTRDGVLIRFACGWALVRHRRRRPCATLGRMKREEALQPLSREHLVALLVAKKLREAESLEQASRAFLEFWRDDGQHHFRIEEEVLLPGWAARVEVDREGVRRMLDEHLTIRREALRLEAGEATLDQARDLGSLLHDHVRFEERQLFPAIEDALDTDGLSRLASAIEEAESARSA